MVVVVNPWSKRPPPGPPPGLQKSAGTHLQYAPISDLLSPSTEDHMTRILNALATFLLAYAELEVSTEFTEL